MIITEIVFFETIVFSMNTLLYINVQHVEKWSSYSECFFMSKNKKEGKRSEMNSTLVTPQIFLQIVFVKVEILFV